MDTTETRQQLQEKQSELEKRLEAVVRDRRKSHSRDWADQAQERENDEVLDGLETETAIELKQVRKALEMIDNDSYGICISCGEAISEERLKILPEANVCIDCASEQG